MAALWQNEFTSNHTIAFFQVIDLSEFGNGNPDVSSKTLKNASEVKSLGKSMKNERKGTCKMQIFLGVYEILTYKKY